MKLKFTYFSAWVFFLCLILGEYSLNAQQTFSKLTNHTDVTADGTYMIVDVNGSYALTSANGSSSAPTAVSVVIENNTIQGEIAAELQWKFTAVEGGYKISSLNDNSVFLYSTNANNGVRVGGGDANIWTLDITNTSTPNYHGFLNNGCNRYLGVYNGSDWRNYNSINTNIKDTQIEIFELNDINTVATPTFSPAGGTYYEPQTVSIDCNTEGATIYYTTDGTEPTIESSVYSSPLVIANSTTVKAIACKEGMENSNVATAEYNIIIGLVTIFDQDWEGEMNGWTFVNVSGSAEWSIESYNNNHYASINGYDTGANVDWCISPAFNLNEYSNTVLTFITAKNYTGPDLEVYFSNDYDGSNPETATWTPLTCTI